MTRETDAKMAIKKKTLGAAGVFALLFFSGLLIWFLGTQSYGTSLPGQTRVACVGDSITEGSGYPENLQLMLGADYKVGNFGVSGSTVLTKSNKPYISQKEFRDVKAFGPSIVIIMLGTNDAQEKTFESIEYFSNDYKQLIREYQTLENNPEIWLVKPPPIFNNNLNLNNTNLEQGVIPCIERIANELSLPLIDVNKVLMEYPEYFGDGVHPNSEGAVLIANEIGQALNLDDSTV